MRTYKDTVHGVSDFNSGFREIRGWTERDAAGKRKSAPVPSPMLAAAQNASAAPRPVPLFYDEAELPPYALHALHADDVTYDHVICR